MLTYQIAPGTTDVSVVLRIVDSTDGTPETGVVFDTAGIDIQYRREGAASTAITEATLAALTTAHTDGGFLHIGNGYYRLDLPDAACATGVAGVLVHGTVTGMVVIGCYIQLEAAIDAIKDETALIVADTNELQTDWANGGRLDLILDARASQTSVDTIDDFLDTEIAAILAAVDTEVAAILADTNELQTDWANGGRLDLLLDATLADTNELQGDWANGGRLDLILDARASQTSVDTIDDFLDTEIAAILAAVDTEVAAIITTLGTPAGASLAADIAAIEGQTDDIGAAGAGLTAVPWNSAWDAEVQSEVNDALDTAIAELTAVPSATPTIRTALMFQYMALRNRRETTATADEIQNDAGTAIATSTLSDDATTFTKGEYV